MSSTRSATRYINSLNSSTKSNPTSSAEFSSSRALNKKKDAAHLNLSSMVKKLVESKNAKSSDKRTKFVVATDFLANDLKKNAKKSSGLSGLHKKLFKGSSGSSSGAKSGEESSKKALTEVKSNTRTLAMVLRSERELLTLNKQQEEQIAELQILLQEKNREAEKLKDLCLKQREEIKSLKTSILFPDAMNSPLQDLVEKQGLELKQARQLIPSLQRQVTSLTGQLQSFAEDLAEGFFIITQASSMKADKYSGRGLCDNHFSSPQPRSYDQEEAANSVVKHFELFDQEFSSGDCTTTPESPDDMFLKDLNPCLTPCAKTKSEEFDVYDSPNDAGYSESIVQQSDATVFNTCATKLSKSAECCQSSKAGKGLARSVLKSQGNKCTQRKQMHHKLF